MGWWGSTSSTKSCSKQRFRGQEKEQWIERGSKSKSINERASSKELLKVFEYSCKRAIGSWGSVTSWYERNYSRKVNDLPNCRISTKSLHAHIAQCFIFFKDLIYSKMSYMTKNYHIDKSLFLLKTFRISRACNCNTFDKK